MQTSKNVEPHIENIDMPLFENIGDTSAYIPHLPKGSNLGS